MVAACPKCGSTDIIAEDNTSYCGKCFVVVEENEIVSEVSFVEGSNGGSSIVGQFVPSTGARSYRKGLHGFSKESRERTIENGRRRIQQVAASLKLASHHIEAAQRLFMLAVQGNFIKGRRTQNVVAACLYIVCRRERTPHMLIDFSDVLQTNVYVLGHTFLRLCQVLNFQVPIIDPSLYIQRFAAKLEFENKTQLVATTALRLVQRMKRDWLQTGRRPSGICGAALLIAARLHGFRRTQKEIVSVVRICDVTLRKRLYEFEDTPSGGLTAEQFETIDLEEECDPPAFTRSRLKEQRKQEKEEEEEEISAKAAASVSRELEESPLESSDLPPNEDIEKEMEETLRSNEFKQIEKDELLRNKAEEGAKGKPKAEAAPKRVRGEDEDETFSDLDDKELEGYFNTQDEIKIKSEIWHELNKDYLELMAAKEKNAAEKPAPKKKRKAGGKKDNAAESAIEAAVGVLKKRVSTKINYGALEDLFNVDQKMFDTKKAAVASDDVQSTAFEEEEPEYNSDVDEYGSYDYD